MAGMNFDPADLARRDELHRRIRRGLHFEVRRRVGRWHKQRPYAGTFAMAPGHSWRILLRDRQIRLEIDPDVEGGDHQFRLSVSSSRGHCGSYSLSARHVDRLPILMRQVAGDGKWYSPPRDVPALPESSYGGYRHLDWDPAAGCFAVVRDDLPDRPRG